MIQSNKRPESLAREIALLQSNGDMRDALALRLAAASFPLVQAIALRVSDIAISTTPFEPEAILVVRGFPMDQLTKRHRAGTLVESVERYIKERSLGHGDLLFGKITRRAIERSLQRKLNVTYGDAKRIGRLIEIRDDIGPPTDDILEYITSPYHFAFARRLLSRSDDRRDALQTLAYTILDFVQTNGTRSLTRGTGEALKRSTLRKYRKDVVRYREEFIEESRLSSESVRSSLCDACGGNYKSTERLDWEQFGDLVESLVVELTEKERAVIQVRYGIDMRVSHWKRFSFKGQTEDEVEVQVLSKIGSMILNKENDRLKSIGVALRTWQKPTWLLESEMLNCLEELGTHFDSVTIHPLWSASIDLEDDSMFNSIVLNLATEAHLRERDEAIPVIKTLKTLRSELRRRRRVERQPR